MRKGDKKSAIKSFNAADEVLILMRCVHPLPPLKSILLRQKLCSPGICPMIKNVAKNVDFRVKTKIDVVSEKDSKTRPDFNEYKKGICYFIINIYFKGEITMERRNAAVAICNTHVDAEQAVIELQKSGIDMKKLSIVGKGYHSEEDVAGYYNTGDRMKQWGKLGAFWGGLWGVLFGSAFFFIPGIGPVAVGGPLVSSIVGGLEGAVTVGGLSALGAGLFGLGIPKDSVLKYETALKADKYLVIVHGSDEEVDKAKNIITPLNISDVTIHHA